LKSDEAWAVEKERGTEAWINHSADTQLAREKLLSGCAQIKKEKVKVNPRSFLPSPTFPLSFSFGFRAAISSFCPLSLATRTGKTLAVRLSSD
jgi:hypothetical protein